MRCLVRETLKSQLAILSILLLIFFCQKLVRIFGITVDGSIPANLVFSPLGLDVPKTAQLILPLSLFLGLLMALGKLYTESEITVVHACGLSKAVLAKAATVLAVFTVIVVAANVMWTRPWSSRHQDEMPAKTKANPGTAALTQGQFQQATNGNSALLIENADGSDFKDVLLVQIRPRGNARPSAVVTDSGYLTQLRDGSQVVILSQGTRSEDIALLCDFRITDFQDYQTIIGHQAMALGPDDIDQMDIRTLQNTNTDRARAELNWRITLVFIVFMMAPMAISLSVVNLCQERVLSMLPAMLLYLLFFLIQTSLKSSGGKGKPDSTLWTWIVNLIYLVLATVLSFWDTVPVRRLRVSSSRKGTV